MKKILLVLLICILLLCGCNKKENNNKNNKKTEEPIDYNVISLKDLISYQVLDNYKLIDTYTLKDFNDENNMDNWENIIVEEDYTSKDDEGYFSVEIFSYKNRDVVGFAEIDEDKYIDILVKKTTLNVDNHTFNIGYSSQDDEEAVIGRAYVRYNDYVILFSMRNSDETITEKQYNEFLSMLKTVKFK